MNQTLHDRLIAPEWVQEPQSTSNPTRAELDAQYVRTSAAFDAWHAESVRLRALVDAVRDERLLGLEGIADVNKIGVFCGMIHISKSETADTRTCDYANVSKETLLDSSVQHISDVGQALEFFRQRLSDAYVNHDPDKITDIDGFHADFVTGFAQTGWWDRHRKINRHHLLQEDGVPADVNLIDVLDFVADCVMAGMARSGSVYPLHLPSELLEMAFQNTVTLLKQQIVVDTETP